MGRLHRSITRKISRQAEDHFHDVLGHFWLLLCSQARDRLRGRAGARPPVSRARAVSLKREGKGAAE